MLLSFKNNLTEDNNLLYKISSFNPESEKLLARKYREKIIFMARRKLGSFEDAEDICHDVLIEIIKAVRENKIKEPEKLHIYIYNTCRNKIIDAIKKKYSMPIEGLDNTKLLKASLEQDESILNKIINEETREKVSEILKTLPMRDRGILYLKYALGWNSSQVGHILGLSSAAVRKKAERAKAKIRENLP